MKRVFVLSLALGLSAFVGGAPAGDDAAGAVPPIGSAGIARVTTVTAEVTAIDHQTREVTLKDENGREHIFVAGEEVRNLAQVEVGDILEVDYQAGLALAVYPVQAGSLGKIENTEVSRAEPGAKPYGAVTKTVDITGRVAALDLQRREVTLEGKHRELVTRVADDVDLTQIKVGDRVRVVYVESLVMSVRSPDTPSQ